MAIGVKMNTDYRHITSDEILNVFEDVNCFKEAVQKIIKFLSKMGFFRIRYFSAIYDEIERKEAFIGRYCTENSGSEFLE
jgi:hypothetical protein